MHLPAVLDDSSKLLEDPSRRKDVEDGFVDADAVEVVSKTVVGHGEHVKDQEDDKVHQLYQVPELRDNEAAVVEDGGSAGFVQRDWMVLVVVGEEIDKRHWGVDDDALVYGVDDELAGG